MNESNEPKQATTPTPTPSAEESLARIAEELSAIRADLDTVAKFCALSETRAQLRAWKPCL